MLKNTAGIHRVVLACSTVDLRKVSDGLAMVLGDKYKQNPFKKGTLFLFCGKRLNRRKELLWMGTGFLLLYKRFEASGSFASNRPDESPKSMWSRCKEPYKIFLR